MGSVSRSGPVLACGREIQRVHGVAWSLCLCLQYISFVAWHPLKEIPGDGHRAMPAHHQAVVVVLGSSAHEMVESCSVALFFRLLSALQAHASMRRLDCQNQNCNEQDTDEFSRWMFTSRGSRRITRPTSWHTLSVSRRQCLSDYWKAGRTRRGNIA